MPYLGQSKDAYMLIIINGCWHEQEFNSLRQPTTDTYPCKTVFKLASTWQSKQPQQARTRPRVPAFTATTALDGMQSKQFTNGPGAPGGRRVSS